MSYTPNAIKYKESDVLSAAFLLLIYSGCQLTYYITEIECSFATNKVSWKNRIVKLMMACTNLVLVALLIYAGYTFADTYQTYVIESGKIIKEDPSKIPAFWQAYADHLGGLRVTAIGMVVMSYQLMFRTFLRFGWLLINKFPEWGHGPNIVFEQRERHYALEDVLSPKKN